VKEDNSLLPLNWMATTIITIIKRRMIPAKNKFFCFADFIFAISYCSAKYVIPI